MNDKTEALERLKEAIKGRPAVNRRKGSQHIVSVAEVSPGDIVTVCDAIHDLNPKIEALRLGSADAGETESVHVNVVDIQFLIAAADKA